jgi:hypothetical protein
MLSDVIALRAQTDLWNPVPLAKTARRPETLAPPARCERCQCWMSAYRQEWETRCWPCQDAEPCEEPIDAAGADQLLNAVAATRRRPARRRRVVVVDAAAVEALDQRLEQRKAERAAAKAARPSQPLTADQQATKERWAQWRARQGDAVPACLAPRSTT